VRDAAYGAGWLHGAACNPRSWSSKGACPLFDGTESRRRGAGGKARARCSGHGEIATECLQGGASRRCRVVGAADKVLSGGNEISRTALARGNAADEDFPLSMACAVGRLVI